MEERLEETRALPLSETPPSETLPSESPTTDLPVTPPAAPAAPSSRPAPGQVLRVAWLSIGLGLLLESFTLLLLASYTGTGRRLAEALSSLDLAPESLLGLHRLRPFRLRITAGQGAGIRGHGFPRAHLGASRVSRVARMAPQGVPRALSLSGSAAAGALTLSDRRSQGDVVRPFSALAIGWVGQEKLGGFWAPPPRWAGPDRSSLFGRVVDPGGPPRSYCACSPAAVELRSPAE